MNVRPIFSAALLLLLSSAAARAEETSHWPATLDTYPEELDLRPLTLPAGVVEPGVDLSVARTPNTALLGSTTRTAEALQVGVAFGITDRAELSVYTPFTLNPDGGWDKVLVPRFAVLAVHSGPVDMAPSVTVPINVAGNGQSAFSDVVVGFGTRVLVNDVVAFTLLEDLLDFQTSGSASLRVNFPVGVSMQLARPVNLSLGTNLFSVSSQGGTSNALIFRDFIPLTARLLLAAGNRADIFGGITLPDAKHAGDVYLFFGGVRFRI